MGTTREGEGCQRHGLLRPRMRHGVASAAILAILLLPLWAGQKAPKPLTKDEVVSLLKGEVPSSRIADLVRERGITFAVTRETETQLRQAGASEDLLKALRQATRRAPAPARPATSPASTVHPAAPVLVIEAKPGGVQVYVDDELVGTTGPEGRLRLSQLTPGEHRVRLALAGRQDYEEKIDLPAGETTRLLASLAPAKGTPSPPAGATGTEHGASPGEASKSNLEQQLGRLFGSQPGGSGGTSLPGPGTAPTTPTTPPSTTTGILTFTVAHDHGPPPPNYCLGWMMVGNGMIAYRSVNGVHWFQKPLSEVKEAKKNALYLAAYGGFHITLRTGETFNFLVVDNNGQYQPPDAVLNAIDQAMR